MRRSSLTPGARYLFPVEGPPISDGRLTIECGRVAWVGKAGDRNTDLDLPDVAITPGFINSHTHLERSTLDGGASGRAGAEDIVAWLRRVVEQRRKGSDEALRAAVGRNLSASLASGTTLLADTTTAGL